MARRTMATGFAVLALSGVLALAACGWEGHPLPPHINETSTGPGAPGHR